MSRRRHQLRVRDRDVAPFENRGVTRGPEARLSVVIFFVALEEPRLNVERVRQRVALGGHSVPEDRIIARYDRSLALLPQAIEQSDRTVLFDNSYRNCP